MTPLPANSASRSARIGPRRWPRVPVAVWVAVVAAHGLFFWAIADKHFQPHVRFVPPPPPPNFGARRDTVVDPATGEMTVETQFEVSTHFSTPPPALASGSASP